MTPYATFTYFGFLLYTALPAVTLGLLGRLTKWFALGATALMLALQFGLLLKLDLSVTVAQFWQLAGYAVWSGAIVAGYLAWKGRPKWAITPAVALMILPLVVIKVVPFLGVTSMWGFLGISYVTFRSLDVLFGIQDGLIKSLRLRDFFLFMLFFPTIASGPIDRYRRFMKDWEKPRTRAEYLADLDVAVDRLFRGFLYKFIVAYWIKRYWMDPAADTHTLLGTLSYMYAYSFYLFFDFAGYSAFAVGVSHVFGVRTPENFDRPWIARNIRDFWNRWHISLSTWFRDHVYMRFVMYATRRKLLPSRFLISAAGFTVSMGLMGVWHGLQWHYIVYGFYHAALMIGIEYLGTWNKQKKVWGDGPLFKWAGVFITFNVVCFGLLIFSGHLF
ncbi:MAG TPA: D-alanyl-lipoteichoic acid biosynthesis protein DltB [Symbiobacteriaceae bacterium]|nr:D-alanyl-lipoteichoic acid biosynthesis protein DltB [Symbiobacteriaceae bacterium]